MLELKGADMLLFSCCVPQHFHADVNESLTTPVSITFIVNRCSLVATDPCKVHWNWQRDPAAVGRLGVKFEASRKRESGRSSRNFSRL